MLGGYGTADNSIRLGAKHTLCGRVQIDGYGVVSITHYPLGDMLDNLTAVLDGFFLAHWNSLCSTSRLGSGMLDLVSLYFNLSFVFLECRPRCPEHLLLLSPCAQGLGRPRNGDFFAALRTGLKAVTLPLIRFSVRIREPSLPFVSFGAPGFEPGITRSQSEHVSRYTMPRYLIPGR